MSSPDLPLPLYRVGLRLPFFMALAQGFISPARMSTWGGPNKWYADNVPIFYAGPRDPLGVGSNYYEFIGGVALEMLVGTLFGSIHCAAWVFQFPSTYVRTRIMSLCIAAVPLVITVNLVMALTVWQRLVDSVSLPVDTPAHNSLHRTLVRRPRRR
ncbi:hypothetical protein GYMLUDRAFT_433633 [Collybiopsis luxurians FD-317 M1]|uniref:Unplaced genomic scaffold GYMLUscaffold_14, whole genome shotgun sequence n=1 Tax=Collybiopsis luxurians FD-317 M1 TaxID=944289 RepID=A0A0D0C7I1_9AGAR|nr:hypothetical protein GYMLUDRAFT_433633 [Collybiopsis luxurians FD-317 M1]